MKPLRLNKVLGLAIGDKSLLAAEVAAGERPDVRRLAEFVYPEGLSPANPEALGKALGDFLRDNKFTAKNAVVGLPARWLVVKSKEVPPAEPATLASLLRLQAEGEFSAELKDLVYDYAADVSAGNPRSVLLVATSKKYIDGAITLCEAARLSAEIVTSSAIALGLVTGRSVDIKNPLVLLVSPSGAELTAQVGGASSAIRHLRGPGPDRPFVGELRRAISGMPGAVNGSTRELVLWDAAGGSAFDSGTLGESLGVKIRTGDLPIFGVNTSDASKNGEGRKYAAAVSLALLGVVEETRPVDFLHSRLAAPVEPRLPRWVIYTAVSVVALAAIIYWSITDLSAKEKYVDALTQANAKQADVVKADKEFEDKVNIARAWHLGSWRYKACLWDLTNASPRDGTYWSDVKLSDAPASVSVAGSPEALLEAAKVTDMTGRVECKTGDEKAAEELSRKMAEFVVAGRKPFTNVTVKQSRRETERGNGKNVAPSTETTFDIDFTYKPPAAPQ